jgi:ligand-binding sensor domain-containing protein
MEDWLHVLSLPSSWRAKRPFLQVLNEYKDEQSIKFDRLLTVFEDNQNNLWLCTENGVFVFNPDTQFFSSFSLLHPSEKRSFDLSAIAALETKDGQLWVSAWGNGLYYFDENLNAIPVPKYLEKYQAGYSIWSMLQDRMNDDIWMGVQGGSILRVNPAKETGVVSPAIIEGRTVRQLAEDHDGNIWIGTQNGTLLKWDRKAAKNDISKGYTKVFKTGMIMKMLIDKKGFLWVAGMAYGVYKIDPTTGKVLERFHRLATDGKTLWNDSPHDLFIYNDSMMMVPGDAINLINMRTNKSEFISTKEGLPSNTARSVQRDSKEIFDRDAEWHRTHEP